MHLAFPEIRPCQARPATLFMELSLLFSNQSRSGQFSRCFSCHLSSTFTLQTHLSQGLHVHELVSYTSSKQTQCVT